MCFSENLTRRPCDKCDSSKHKLDKGCDGINDGGYRRRKCDNVNCSGNCLNIYLTKVFKPLCKFFRSGFDTSLSSCSSRSVRTGEVDRYVHKERVHKC